MEISGSGDPLDGGVIAVPESFELASSAPESDRERGTVAKRFRHAASQYPTGVTLLATMVGDQPHGMTVNSFITVSLRPLMVLVSVNQPGRTYELIRRSGVFAITVLSAEQQDMASWFADPNRPAGAGAFAHVAWQPAAHTGSPILTDGVCYFDCVVDDLRPAGDHAVVIGCVRAFAVLSQRPPLLFVHGRMVGSPRWLGEA
jgi:flavin reductase (DIM6/NTAB) family NADH-FMN oxidoreductase RutF